MLWIWEASITDLVFQLFWSEVNPRGIVHGHTWVSRAAALKAVQFLKTIARRLIEESDRHAALMLLTIGVGLLKNMEHLPGRLPHHLEMFCDLLVFFLGQRSELLFIHRAISPRTNIPFLKASKILTQLLQPQLQKRLRQ